MPALTILAGPNGAGKTQLSQSLLEQHFLSCSPINIDVLENQIDVNKLPHDFLRYNKVRSKEIDKIFTSECIHAIKNSQNFSHECNLRIDQLRCVKLFEDAGYELNLIYIWLNNVVLSEKRVEQRVATGGHYVDLESIHLNYEEGLRNLYLSYNEWNNLYVFDNSKNFTCPTQTFSLFLYSEAGNIKYISPEFRNNVGVHNKLPRIFENI